MINSANANTTFTTTTNVATTTTNVLQTYTLTDIIQKINNAGISNVTASSDNNRLKITQDNPTHQTQFSPTISVGTQNATVGFSTVQETIPISKVYK